MNSSPTDLAQVVHELLLENSVGSLATHSLKHSGFPYNSVMPYAIKPTGDPIFLISALATHTRNVKSNPNASLLVANRKADPLASARATLIGTVEKVTGDEVAAAKSVYFEAHPKSKQWGGLHDFAIYQMTVVEAYVVAGFGSMGWVPLPKFRASFPESL